MRTLAWALAVLLLAAAAAWAPVARAQEGSAPGVDARALLALRDSITNWPAFAATNNIRGWDASLPMCRWSGVTCTGKGRVQSLSLQCDSCPMEAQGSLPAQLADLSAATTVNLQGNALGGPLPQQWGSATALQALQSLYLNDNYLSGSIPASWGDPGALPQLSLLRIDGNRLGGSLPASWGGGGSSGGPGNESLPNLLVLRLFSNQLIGELPAAWGSAGSFPRLQVLALHNNSLTGAVPSAWQGHNAMRYLQELYLQGNRLSGQLPSSWGRNSSWPMLHYLYLSSNPLGGTLPPEWGEPGSFPALKVLQLNDTQLTGPLPPEWGDGGFAASEAFWLERNELRGAVPASWAGLTSLGRLVVRPGNPQLCGPVPQGLPFAICTDADLSCLKEKPMLLEGSCVAAVEAGGGTPQVPWPPPEEEPGAAAAEPAAAAMVPPQPAPSSGDGVPAAAIAAPVAVGVVLLAAAAGGTARAAGRRRRRRRESEARRVEVQRDQLRAHPFDSEEGRSAFTSPFAAGAFQSTAAAAAAFHTGGSHSDASEQQQAARVGNALPPQGSRSPGLHRGPHDSAGTRNSSRSGSSYCSFLAAKCARIDTKSLKLGGSSSESGIGSGGADAGSGAVAEPAARPGALAVEMQAVGAGMLSPSELEEQEYIGAMLSGQQQGESDRASGEDPSGVFTYPELPFSDWEISPAEIEIAKRPDGSDWSLGSGGFGKVYKGLRHGVQPVAVKVLSMQGEGRQLALADFRKEIAILKACRDVNIVQFVGASLSPDRTMLVTEYMEGGNLAHNIAGGRVSWYRRGKKIALDVARGLVFLHSRRVVHFDLKSPNILLARDGTAKIADVGMAKILAREYVTGVVGTLAWAAPEMLWGERCTEKSDIYSYGIVLWEIASGEKPVRGQLRDLRVPQECPAGARDLILECLETSPSRRPSALEIVQRLHVLPVEPPPGAEVQPPSSPSQHSTAGHSSAAAAAAAGRGTPPSSASAGSCSTRSADAPVAPGRPTGCEASSSGSLGGASLARLVLAARSRSESMPPLPATAASRLRHQQWQPGQVGASSTAAAPAAAGAQAKLLHGQQQERKESSGARHSI